MCALVNLIDNFSDKWSFIGLGLGFIQPELNQIRAMPSLLTTAPKSYLTELLSKWVQWPTVNHPTKPTLSTLCEALRSSSVGLGSLAEQVEREMTCPTTGKGTSAVICLKCTTLMSDRHPVYSVRLQHGFVGLGFT